MLIKLLQQFKLMTLGSSLMKAGLEPNQSRGPLEQELEFALNKREKAEERVKEKEQVQRMLETLERIVG